MNDHVNDHFVSQDDGIGPPTNSWQIQRPFNTDQPTAARSSQAPTNAENSVRAALRIQRMMQQQRRDNSPCVSTVAARACTKV